MGVAIAVAARANVAPISDLKCIVMRVLFVYLFVSCETEKRKQDQTNRVDVEWTSFHCSRALSPLRLLVVDLHIDV